MKFGSGLARGALLFAGTVAGAAAFAGCATIWGFEDTLGPLDGGDAGEAASDAVGLGDTAEAGYASLDGAAGYDAAPSGSCTQACVPPVPNGWTGPFVVAEASGSPGLPPPCGSGYSTPRFTGNAEPVALDATCGCTCSPPTGGSCGTPLINFFNDSKCASPCGTRNQKAGACGPLDTSGCGLLVNPRYSLAAPIVSPGACEATPTKSGPPPVTWQSTVQVCGAAATEVPAGRCNGGLVCAASPPPSFTGHCVMSPGILNCPADYPAQKRQYFGGDSDSRDCKACTCGPVTGAACGIGTWSDSSCKSTGTPYTGPQACLPPGLPYVANLTATPGGTCTPMGGTPIGQVLPAEPTTICCTAP